MDSKRKQIHVRQKEYYSRLLRDRLSFLAAKGIPAPKAAKDTLARKWRAAVKAIDRRLKLMAEHEKRSEEMARIKAERAAAPKKEEAPPKEPAGDKAAKPKKTAEGKDKEGKEKKPKPEKKPAPPKAPEGEKKD